MLKYGLGMVVFAVATEVVWQLWKYTRRNEKRDIMEILIFTEDSANCRDHAIKLGSCGKSYCPGSHLKQLVDYFDSAKKTLDVCIYILTYRDLSEAIIRAHKRDVTIRFIVDAAMSENGGCCSQLNRLRRAGIKIRMRRSVISLMHHKFAVIDREVIIYGSTNWTMQAFFGNWDAILITNQEKFVRVFLAEFDKMWSMMDVTD